jgi:hypothetical protein
MEEEIHHRGDDEQCQQEAEDGPTATRLGSDWGVVDRVANAAEARACCFRVTQFRILYRDAIGLNRAGGREISRAAGAQRVRACVYSEARRSVHEYLDVPRTLRGERLRQLGYEVFSRKGDELFCEVALDLFMRGSLDRLCFRIRGMDGEAASGLGLDMEGEFELLIFERELQAREFRRKAGGDVCLDLSLQFLARWGLERRDCGIGSVSDESAFGLGLDSIGEMRDQAFEFHVARL